MVVRGRGIFGKARGELQVIGISDGSDITALNLPSTTAVANFNLSTPAPRLFPDRYLSYDTSAR
jgi:hypothetical protein